MATPQSVVYLAPAVAKGSALMEQSNGSSKQLLCLSSVSDASKKTRRICLIHFANWCWKGKYFIFLWSSGSDGDLMQSLINIWIIFLLPLNMA